MGLDINVFGQTYSNIEGITVSAVDGESIYTYIVPSGTITITAVPSAPIDVTQYAEANITITPSLQIKEQTITPSIDEQSITITPDSNFDGLEQVNVTVQAAENAWTHLNTENNILSIAGATATTTTSINYTISNINLNNTQCVCIRIQDKNDHSGAPTDSSYFCASYTFFINNFLTSPIKTGAVHVYRKSGDEILTAVAPVGNGYGIYVSSLEKNNDTWTIKFSYKMTSTSGTITDGDYQIDIFTLDFPTEYPLPF